MQSLSALFLAALAVGHSTPAIADTVLSVGDGDTLTVTGTIGRRTIRLACVDAPETAQRPYGYAARAALQQLVPVGSRVQIEVGDTDRYGRTVAEVWRGSTNVNLQLVVRGHAFVYRQYLRSPCSSNLYLSAEQKAQRAGLGVWAVSGGITRPWNFRHGRQSSASRNRSNSGASDYYTCRSIGSWAGAQELLREGHTYLDRDGDGVACESLK